MNTKTNCPMNSFVKRLYKKLIIFLFLFLPIYGYSQVTCDVGDSLTLVEFYWSANGPNWINSDNWLTTPVNSWYGVFLWPDSVPTAPYRVINISLVSNNLTGTISPLLCNLDKLTTLVLMDNNTTGCIPACIGQLMHFETLIVSFNHLTNPLPTFANCPLQSIRICYNDFWGAVPDTLINHSVFFTAIQIQHNHFSSFPKKDTFYFMNQLYELSYNCFTFKDVIPYIGVNLLTCTYDNQDSVLQTIDTTIIAGSDLSLDSWVDTCQDNMYRWKRNGVYLSTYIVPESYYNKPNIQFADSGNYTCEITNFRAPELILHRRMVHVKVTDSTIGIPVPAKPKEIELYYNLSDALLTIKINQNRGEFVQCYLYDITGRQVLRLFQGKTAQQELHYYLKEAGIKTGPYFVKLEINGELITKKIIVP